MKTIIIWFTGLSSSGKTAIGKELIKEIDNSFLLDGDILRSGLNINLGFSLEDRLENIRRAAEVAKILNLNNINVIATFITPTNYIRNMVKQIIPNVKFIYLSTPLNICEERDAKGLYQKARNGTLKNFTGIDSKFEEMNDAWLTLDTSKLIINECIEETIKKLHDQN